MREFFDMGGYAAFVWPAYTICSRRYGGPPAIDPPPTSITA